MLVLGRCGVDVHGRPAGRVTLRGVDNAKFRKQVVPGDRLRVEVSLGRQRGAIVRARASADVDGQTVAEAELLLAVSEDRGRARSDRARAPEREDRRRHGRRTVRGDWSGRRARPTMPHRRLGHHRRAIRPSATRPKSIPFASIGLPPQDLKYKGEPTTLEIGQRNIFREFVTIHRGTAGGGGRTTIGDRNLFMGYVHVAHDCHVGSDTIFGPHATLGGHVSVEDFANISAGSAVHQFCRVGPARLHRRLFGGDEGRAAVRADGRQPSGPDLRHQLPSA